MRLEIETDGQEVTALNRYNTNLKTDVSSLQKETLSKPWVAVFVMATVCYLHTKQV
jgi:hypothetical protein